MRVNKIFVSLLILLGILFLGLQFQQMEHQAMGIRSLGMIALAAYYLKTTQNKSQLFLLFLLIFTIADILNFLTWDLMPEHLDSVDYWFYIINSCYIASYLFLMARIVKFWDWSVIWKELRLQIVLLLILDVFFVYMVTYTTSSILPRLEFSVDLFYNAIIMALLSIALINYMYRDDNKSMNLLLGTIFIVFSEVIQLAYFYISDIQLLNVAYSIFLVIAFLFFYLQSQMAYREKVDYLGEEVRI